MCIYKLLIRGELCGTRKDLKSENQTLVAHDMYAGGGRRVALVLMAGVL